jgi:hypothetical protein
MIPSGPEIWRRLDTSTKVEGAMGKATIPIEKAALDRRRPACCSTKVNGSDESPSLNKRTIACPPRYPALATNTDSRTCCSVAPVADARVLLYTIDSSAEITAARDVPAFRFTIVSGVPLSSVTATRTRPSSTGRLSTVATATSMMSLNTADDTLPDASTMITTSCNKKLQNGATGVVVGDTDRESGTDRVGRKVEDRAEVGKTVEESSDEDPCRQNIPSKKVR